ncbi:MAG: dihydropteroate synthase, partial [Elusimicrobia bacterium]|nr:dihydropteroate synthase [Elusimicrobiota bacterium]
NTAVVGAFSRKSLISNVIGTKDNAVLDAHTVALSALSAAGGVDILRVHNVKMTADILKIVNLYNG